MTSLDDALNSAAPLFAPSDLEVTWKEVPDGNWARVGENLTNMSDQMTGKYGVEQSFDDALPDPVTLTGSNDASGKFEAELLGRGGLVVGTAAMAVADMSYAGVTDNSFNITLTGTSDGSYVLALMIVNNANPYVTEASDTTLNYAWTKLAQVTDGNYTMFVYGRNMGLWVTGGYEGDPYFILDQYVTNSTIGYVVFNAKDPSGNILSWRVTSVLTGTAASSVTSHTLPTVSVANKGFVVGLWGSDSNVTFSSVTGGATRQDFQANAGTSGMVATTPYTAVPATYTLGATSSVATGNAVYMALAVEPVERPRMTPTQYWSPFNPDSPVLGFDRDTAGVELTFNTVTDTGIQGTPLFSGVMNDIGLQPGQAVTLSASSRTRIDLNNSVNLPMVFGRREGATVDFFVAWILARAGKFFGPAPGSETRYWVPCYGSVHAGLDAYNGYNYAQCWDAATTPSLPRGVRFPTTVPGKFHTAMYACQTATYTQEVVMDAIDLYLSTETLPYWDQTDVLHDQLCLNESFGRISFWLRGDTVSATPINVPSANNYIFQYVHQARTSGGGFLGSIWIYISPVDYAISVQMGSDAGGYSTFSWPAAWHLPTDGAWHFYSIAWSFSGGQVSVRMDNNQSGTAGYATAGNNNTTGWYATDDALYAAGGKIVNTIRSHVPISDVILEAGIASFNNGYFSSSSEVWPTPPSPSFTATGRPSNSPLQAVALTAPVTGWDTLADLARNVMAYYRADEVDNFDFLPPTYFGEVAQLTPTEVTDTDVNAQDLAITTDPSKSRNVVTVQFKDTSVDESPSPVLSLTSAFEIPRGVSIQTFTLEFPIAELHGASAPHNAWWTLTNLTSSQINAGTQPYLTHFMAVNTKSDGSGTVVAASSVTGQILSFTTTSVTIQFTNKLSGSGWLANSYQSDTPLPSLRILGYAIQASDGYVTERDSGSIGVRRERAMDIEMSWIQDRNTAQQFASALVTALARPRQVVTVQTQGDPRIVPGIMVTLKDAQQTQASGTWRILSVNNDADGPQYLQTLQLVYVPPVAVWDSGTWDETIWSQ